MSCRLLTFFARHRDSKFIYKSITCLIFLLSPRRMEPASRFARAMGVLPRLFSIGRHDQDLLAPVTATIIEGGQYQRNQGSEREGIPQGVGPDEPLTDQ